MYAIFHEAVIFYILNTFQVKHYQLLLVYSTNHCWVTLCWMTWYHADMREFLFSR